MKSKLAGKISEIKKLFSGKVRNYIVGGIISLGVGVFQGCRYIRPDVIGYEYWNFGDNFKHEHKTHPDDQSFLIGDAGATNLRRAHFLKLGSRSYIGEGVEGLLDSSDSNENPLRFYWGDSLLLGYGRDEHKNRNDPRPTGHHSAIYTKVFPIAPQIEAGTEYSLTERLKAGVGISGTMFFVKSGWDRFDEDQTTEHSQKFFINLGPTIRYELSPSDKGPSFEINTLKNINGGAWSAFIGLTNRF